MVRETKVQSQVASYRKIKKWYLILPGLTLSIIRYLSRVKWSKPEKGLAPSPTHWCCSYWKGSLLVAFDYGRQIYGIINRFIWTSFLISHSKKFSSSSVMRIYHCYNLLFWEFFKPTLVEGFLLVLSASKFPQVFRILLSIVAYLYNAEVWILLFYSFESSFTPPLVNGFPMRFKWQQVSSSPQDSS